jgi:hypothetical protein
MAYKHIYQITAIFDFEAMGKKSILSNLLLSSILISSCVAGACTGYIGFVKNVYAQNTWYLGQGVQPNTYYTYKIQEHDTKQGQPYIMTVYFKSYNNTGNYWIAPTTVVYNGKVINGTLHLSSLDLTPLGTSKIPVEMADFISGYKDSIAWLSAFVPKPGLSLTAPYWGKIAAIGGSAVAPGGGATVTVPAGTYHTTVVTWHYGVDNNIYVDPSMPYPVKAETFAATTGGNPPIQYAFDLEATGQGQPPVPKSTAYAPKPPITIQTARGTYFIEIVGWQPPTITAGKPTQIGLLFKDSQQNVINDVTYSVKATEGNTTVSEVHDQHAADGTGIQTITFPKPGPVNLYISVDGAAGVPTGEFVESATFNLVVS